MNPRLQTIQYLLRSSGLLRLADQLRFWSAKALTHRSNVKFLAEHPGFAVPPAHLSFDAYNNVNWSYYYQTGLTRAKSIADEIKRFADGPIVSLYEWGCGPARVLRHMPSLFENCDVYGSDYNAETIEWCSKNIPSIQFALNGLYPPLLYPDSSFDFTYALSVFTHLSAENCLLWSKEIQRILRPGGLLFFSTHGEY